MANVVPLPEPDWLHLKPFGYAPGSYMSRCMYCTNVVAELDKRAVSCRPCAQSAADNAALRADNIRLQNEVVGPLRERVKVLEDALTNTEKTIVRQVALIAARAPGNYLDKRPVVQSLQLHVQRLRAALGDKL